METIHETLHVCKLVLQNTDNYNFYLNLCFVCRKF